MAEQEYLTNVRDHAAFELTVETYRDSGADVQYAALGYLARTIRDKHRNARWLELDWGCDLPARLEPGDVLDENGIFIEDCQDVDTDLWRVPSWIEEGPILDEHAERVNASAYRLDLVKAAGCYAPDKISMKVDRKLKREAKKSAQQAG